MKVLKFGGTSVGTIEGILNVKKIVEAENEPVIVVVSALSGITDQLYNVSKLASQGDESYIDEYRTMLTRHIDMISTVVDESKIEAVTEVVKAEFNDLANILRGLFLIRDTSPKIHRKLSGLRRKCFVGKSGKYHNRCCTFRCKKLCENGQSVRQTQC